MTLVEAKKTLYDLVTTKPQVDPEKRREAVRLGIEAIKFTEAIRVHQFQPIFYALPGETKD